MSFAETIFVLAFLAFVVALFLGVSWVVIEGISSTKVKRTKINWVYRFRVKFNEKLRDAKTRYKYLLVFFAPWWVLGECFAVLTNLVFQGSLNNAKYQTITIIIIVVAKAIAQILSFLVAALLVKLFIDKVDRVDK